MAMNKVIDIQSAIDKVKKNDTVLLGGFGNVGAPMHLLYELAKRPENKGKVIVALLPDTGERYLSTPMFEA